MDQTIEVELTAEETLEVPLSEATDRQLMLAVYAATLRMETRMSELSAEVGQLQQAVDGVAQRLLPQLEILQAEKDALSADAAAAVDAISAEVDQLNSMGANPETPVEPAP